jgi:hypothetical protein
MKKAYGYNEAGEFTGEVDCQPSPLEFGKYLIPAMATEVAPPKPKKGHTRVWTGEKWIHRKLAE